jgi:hypothetical protein
MESKPSAMRVFACCPQANDAIRKTAGNRIPKCYRTDNASEVPEADCLLADIPGCSNFGRRVFTNANLMVRTL